MNMQNMLNKQNKMNKWLALLSIFILSACGGGSDSSPTVPTPEPEPEPTQITIYAENTTDYISAGVSGTIDLSSHIKTSDGSAVYIKSVKALNNVRECSDFKVNTLSFEVKVNDITSCNYEYTVSNSANTVSATKLSRVATQGARNSTGLALPIISKVTQINATVITDLVTELGSAWFAGKSLDQNSIVLLGNGTATPETNNRIQFDNITTPGYATILYSVIDETTGDTYLGSIVISISTDIYNRAPTAASFDAKADGAPTAVDEDVFINVATETTGNISDPDADTLTLVDVIAINTTVELIDSTRFKFSTKNVGTSYITYIISDGKGGYATAQIKINVPFPPNTTQAWEDITIPNTKNGDKPITFTAPISKKLADYYNISYSGSTTEDGTKGPEKVEIVLMNAEQATDYCTTRNGRLPTLSELDMLYNNRGRSLWESDKWPTSNVFWSADGLIKYTLYALKARSLFDAAEPEILFRLSGNAYTTCVLLKPDNSVPDFTLSPLEDVSNDEGYRYTTTLKDPYGNAAKYLPITLSTEDKLGRFLDSDNAEQETAVQFTDADGVLTFDYISPDLKDEIIEARYLPNIARNIIFKTAEIKEEEIEVDNVEAGWNRAVTGGTDQSFYNENKTVGLPIFHGYGRALQVSNVYRISFTGRDFSAYFGVKVSNVLDGAYSFFLQQVSGEPKSTWAANTSLPYPGAPMTNKEINLVIDTKSNSGPNNPGRIRIFYGYKSGTATAYTSSQIQRVLNQVVHHWIEKKGQTFKYYISRTPNKSDAELIFSIPFIWEDEATAVDDPNYIVKFDPTQPYWLGFGSYRASTIYSECSGFLKPLSFGAK